MMEPSTGESPAGSYAWSREAQRVRRLAAKAGLALEEADLVLHDVRDLQVMAERLRQAGQGRGRGPPGQGRPCAEASGGEGAARCPRRGGRCQTGGGNMKV
jgi:hypothetical protein